jgi:hypothetical protein
MYNGLTEKEIKNNKKKVKEFEEEIDKIDAKLDLLNNGNLKFDISYPRNKRFVTSATVSTSRNYQRVHPKIYGSNITELWNKVKPTQDAGNAYWATAGREAVINILDENGNKIDTIKMDESWGEDHGYYKITEAEIKERWGAGLRYRKNGLQYDVDMISEILEEELNK